MFVLQCLLLKTVHFFQHSYYWQYRYNSNNCYVAIITQVLAFWLAVAILIYYIITSPPDQKARTLSHYKTITMGRENFREKRWRLRDCIKWPSVFLQFETRRGPSLPHAGSDYAQIPCPPIRWIRSLVLTILVVGIDILAILLLSLVI